MTLEDELNALIQLATESATESVADYTALAEGANEQLNGDNSADAGEWLKLAARAYARAAGDAAKALTTGLDVLQRVANDANAEGDGDD